MATVPTAKLRIVSLRPRLQATTNTGDAITATRAVMMTVVVMTVSMPRVWYPTTGTASCFQSFGVEKPVSATGRSTQNGLVVVA